MKVDTIAVAAGEMLMIISGTRPNYSTNPESRQVYVHDAPIRIEAALALAKLQKVMPPKPQDEVK